MRTIKFRAKRKDSGDWVYGFYVETPLTAECFADPECGLFFLQDRLRRCIVQNNVVHEIDETTLGQFTGLLDKNGVEIYEGDVVRSYGYDGSAKNTLGRILWERNVVFVDGMFTADDDTHPLLGYDVLGSCSHEEVIGNIYDNPEWFKGE